MNPNTAAAVHKVAEMEGWTIVVASSPVQVLPASHLVSTVATGRLGESIDVHIHPRLPEHLPLHPPPKESRQPYGACRWEEETGDVELELREKLGVKSDLGGAH
jgi:hypothetical protein